MTRWIAVVVCTAAATVGLVLYAQKQPGGTWPGVDSRPPNDPAQKPAFEPGDPLPVTATL